MKRSDKVTVVEEMNQVFKASPNMILARFSGLEVNQANDLRRKISSAGGRFKVVKNRLAKRAAKGTPAEHIMERFVGPCAIATHESDPVILAKTLSTFVKDNPQIELLAGVIESSDVVEEKDLKTLASLPGLDELRAQLLCLIQTPATTLVRLVNTPGGQLARVIDAHREAQGGEAASD